MSQKLIDVAFCKKFKYFYNLISMDLTLVDLIIFKFSINNQLLPEVPQ